MDKEDELLEQVNTLAKEMFTKWQVTKREKAIVWERLSMSPTGKLGDGFTLRHNFMRKAYMQVFPNDIIAPGAMEYGVSYKDGFGTLRVRFGTYPWAKEPSQKMVDTHEDRPEMSDVKLVPRRLELPHENTGR